jgi:dihydrodipicolinate synthase/N-acetylneuraminate lyase
MAAALFTGAGVALVFLFDDDGRFLVEETVEHAVDLVERGRAPVIVGSGHLDEEGAARLVGAAGAAAVLALSPPHAWRRAPRCH